MEISVNKEQGVFVQNFNDGCTTLGSDQDFKILAKIVHRLGLSIPVRENEKGTLSQYLLYKEAIKAYADARLNETWHHPDALPEVSKIIDRCIKNGTRVRLFYGDTNTGHEWGEENDVLGTIRRTTGPLKSPIMIPKGEHSGSKILEHCLLKIMDADTHSVLWVHKHYQTPAFAITEDHTPKLPFMATMNGQLKARFTSFAKAAAWVAFMSGECMQS
jgi:hypothetical protein